jgi:hypothetical protein
VFHVTGLVSTPCGALIFGCERSCSVYVLSPNLNSLKRLACAPHAKGPIALTDGPALSAIFFWPVPAALVESDRSLYVCDLLAENTLLRRVTVPPRLFVPLAARGTCFRHKDLSVGFDLVLCFSRGRSVAVVKLSPLVDGAFATSCNP